MRRDLDLCRRILIEIESWNSTQSPREICLDGYSKDEVGYHAWLLAEEEMIVGSDVTTLGVAVCQFWPRSLTLKGHDFLESARDNARWTEAKKQVMRVGGPMALDTLQAVLRRLIGSALGLTDV